MEEINYKDSNLYLFKNILNKFKNLNNKENDSVGQMQEFFLFNKVHKLFDILSDLTKFMIISNKKYYHSFVKEMDIKSLDDFDKLEINLLEDTNSILNMFAKYPDIIDLCNDELFQIISLKNYDGLLMLKRIKMQLFFNVFNNVDDYEKIAFFKESIINFELIIKMMIKKMIKINIEIAKLP
jgi:hypothetical protein